MSYRRPREQARSPYDSDDDRHHRSSRRAGGGGHVETEYIRPSGYESPPPNYSENTPRARDSRDRERTRYHDADRDAGNRRRHHSIDAHRPPARHRYDNYPSDSEDSEEEYRRRSRRQKPREKEAEAGDRDRGRHYPPRAGEGRRGRESYYPPRAGGGDRDPRGSTSARTPARGSSAGPAPSRTRSWSESFASSGAKEKMMAAGSAALAAGAAEAWRCRKDKGKLMEKGFKVGTAAAGAAAVAAFKSGGKEAEGRREEEGRRDDRGRRDARYDERHDDRYADRGGGGGGKTDALKSAIGGILVQKMARSFMGGK